MVTGFTLSPTLKGDHRGKGCVGPHSLYMFACGGCVCACTQACPCVCAYMCVCSYMLSDTCI